MPTTYSYVHAAAMAAVCCFCVSVFPDSLQHPWMVIPINGWTGIHLLTTCAIVPTLDLTPRQLGTLVLAWELLENGIGVVFAPHFREQPGDVLGDVLVALPAAWIAHKRTC